MSSLLIGAGREFTASTQRRRRSLIHAQCRVPDLSPDRCLGIRCVVRIDAYLVRDALLLGGRHQAPPDLRVFRTTTFASPLGD